jgi:endoglucanase
MRARPVVAGMAGLVLAADLVGVATLSPARAAPPPVPPAVAAQGDALAFLSRYEASDGRVVRSDQGGDTVSEGQAYAMLLAVAIGDSSRFTAAWHWELSNLRQPDGLFAWHWVGGKVVDTQSAADADVQSAWALLLAASRFGQAAYRTDALQIGTAILANETVTAGGHLQLVAGPWARPAPAVVDPSYDVPAAFAALAAASGDQRWTALEQDSLSMQSTLSSSGRLPPDWATLAGAGGAPVASGPPGSNSAPAYGLDAQRVPVWTAGSCPASARAIARQEWPALSHLSGNGKYISYTLSGQSTSSYANPLGVVAVAAGAAATGDASRSASLLDTADQQAASYHTYYGDAWVALGRILLETPWLTGCPPAA